MKAVDRPIRVASIAILVTCAFVFATRRYFYLEALTDPYFALALLSVLILHFQLRRRVMDALWIGICSLIFAFIDFRLLHDPPKLMAWFSFFGVSSLLVLGVASLRATGHSRKLLLFGWIPALLFLASDWFASDMLGWVSAIRPKTLDLYLLSFDASLHIQPSFIFGRMFARVGWLHIPGLIAYVGLAIPITLVYAGRLARFGTKAFSAMLAFLVTGPVGILFYCMFPACGPAHIANGHFPFDPLSISEMSRMLMEPIAVAGFRNSMPSLHMTWVLLAWWYSRGLSKIERGIVVLFVAFTIFATLGTGEHYFIDLVVAFPFALFIQAACAYELGWKNRRRLSAAAFGLGTVLAWLVALRFANRLFWASPAVPWSLVIATIALVEFRRAELTHADVQGSGAQEARRIVAVDAR